METTPVVKTLLDMLSCPVILWSPDGSSFICNEMVKVLVDFSCEQSESNASLWLNRIHPKDRGHYSNSWKKIREGENIVACEYRFLSNLPDKKELRLKDMSLCCRDSDGKCYAVISICKEISDLKDRPPIDKALEESSEVADIIGGQMHEITNYLQVLRLEVEFQQGLSANLDFEKIVTCIEAIDKITRELGEKFDPPA